MLGRGAVAAAAVTLAACAYNAAPVSTGSVNIVSAYSSKIPGRYALVIEPGELSKVIRPRGVQCAAHNYPLDMRDGFRSSVRSTLANVFENIEEVPSPVQADTLRAQGYRGQIIVRGETLEGKLIAVPGFWTASISTTIEVAASITVDGPNGRLVGKTVGGSAEREAEAGPLCSGGAASVEEASTQALKKLLLQLGETAANSDRLRQI